LLDERCVKETKTPSFTSHDKGDKAELRSLKQICHPNSHAYKVITTGDKEYLSIKNDTTRSSILSSCIIRLLFKKANEDNENICYNLPRSVVLTSINEIVYNK